MCIGGGGGGGAGVNRMRVLYIVIVIRLLYIIKHYRYSKIVSNAKRCVVSLLLSGVGLIPRLHPLSSLRKFNVVALGEREHLISLEIYRVKMSVGVSNLKVMFT